MTRIRNVRNATKFKRSIKAISPVIATLLMIAIAVVASLVAYAWVMGYMGFTTNNAGKAIQIQSFAPLNGNLVIYVQNVGQGDVELNRDQSVYVDSTLIPLRSTMPAKIPITVGQTVELLTDFAYTAGTKVTIKVTTTDGTYMIITGTGTSNASPNPSASPTPTPTATPTPTEYTFGTTTMASFDSNGNIENYVKGSLYRMGSVGGTAQSITAYVLCETVNRNMKAAIYNADHALVAATQEVSVSFSATGQWVTFNFAGTKPSLTASTDYILVVWSSTGSGDARLSYTSGSGINRQWHYSGETTYSTTWPSIDSGSGDSSQRAGSIYCTYTVP